MTARQQDTWAENGSRATTCARDPKRFINQHVSPLFFRCTEGAPNAGDCRDIVTEEQFWSEEGNVLFRAARLRGFKLTDWFPRAPGVYWSRYAERARKAVRSGQSNADPELGTYFSPRSKMALIEDGGIGTIRLRPRRIEGEACWLGTALTGTACHGGIPLAIPDTVLRKSGLKWGDQCNLRGQVRFLQDAGLEDTAGRVHHARPLIVFVEELEGMATRRSTEPIIITPVALFTHTARVESYADAQYAFVQCKVGADTELDAAVDWIEKYASKYAGRVITNFDEQRPVLADAPLSYQRLVAKTYDRAIVSKFAGATLVDRIDLVNDGTNISRVLYDVALSFAGENRDVARLLADGLTAKGIKVFYDEYEQATLWGKDLYVHLSDVYSNKARYCIMLLSEHYAAKLWTNHERKAAQERAFHERKEYILPLKIDDTSIPGILTTTGYLDLRSVGIDDIVSLLIKKLQNP